MFSWRKQIVQSKYCVSHYLCPSFGQHSTGDSFSGTFMRTEELEQVSVGMRHVWRMRMTNTGGKISIWIQTLPAEHWKDLIRSCRKFWWKKISESNFPFFCHLSGCYPIRYRVRLPARFFHALRKFRFWPFRPVTSKALPFLFGSCIWSMGFLERIKHPCRLLLEIKKEKQSSPRLPFISKN